MFTYLLYGYCLLGVFYAIRTSFQYKHLVFYEIPIMGLTGFVLWPLLALVDVHFLWRDLQNKNLKKKLGE